MSRRSIWQNMRMEARSRVSDVETTPLSQDTPNNDTGRRLSVSSNNEQSLTKSDRSSREMNEEATVEKNNKRKKTTKSKTHKKNNNNTNNNNNNNYDDGSHSQERKEKSFAGKSTEESEEEEEMDNTAVRRLHSLENTATPVPLVSVLDVQTGTSMGKSVPSEVTPVVTSTATTNTNITTTTTTTTYVAEPPVREMNPLMKDESNSREDTGRDSSMMRHESSYLALQVELAEEKKKNIDAEQRLLTLEKEIKVLRSENMRLASLGAEGGNVVNKNTPAAAAGGDHTWEDMHIPISGEHPSPLEQMVKELQDELRMMKQYTKELESRLAVKSTALEQRTREVEQKENRIRQLERTIADELIWRSKEEAAHHGGEGTNSSGSRTPRGSQKATTTPTPITSTIIPTSTGPTIIPTTSTTIITSTSVTPPAVVRVQAERGRSQSHAHAHTHAHALHPTINKKELLSPDRPSSVPQSRHPSSARVVVQPKEHVKEKEKTIPSSSRRAASNSRRSSAANISTTAMRVRRKESTDSTLHVSRTATATAAVSSTTTAPSRTSSATRKKTASKPTHPSRRAATNIKRTSLSPTPYVALFDDPLRDETSSRRPVKRPATLETSAASLSLLSNHTGTTTAAPLHNLDTRSVASTVRSRPRIHQDSDGITTTTTMRSSTTTVVTRSVKRRESPSLVPQPRPDYVEEQPSEQPFVSEKFSTTTYRPNRLVRYYKSGDSEPRSTD
ncbi:uncharacterized protein TM35_000201390 [Trypanosoma theileri]|uniref:Uncharacterized protein n=1 Tax=Trypanosoma theileri TaxID=67003 RepID=A0A1X0NUF0_9TRYP|nr:uncharacterized protein TM35_000201390 [Trypanosoma theileri]ORC87730.1 hypothetical protein TM35_000201390 [Trypanosoma theileri]